MYTSNNAKTAAVEEALKEALNMLSPEQLERFIAAAKKSMMGSGRENKKERDKG